MKSFIITLILSFMCFAGLQAQTQNNNKDQFSVKIKGMGCPYCASAVENEMTKLKGVSNFLIDIQKGTMTFSYPAEKDLSLEEVKEKIKAAGYTPAKAKVVRAKEEEISTKSRQTASMGN